MIRSAWVRLKLTVPGGNAGSLTIGLADWRKINVRQVRQNAINRAW
jgi:hypothetical protein